ncbi:hypothetical protein BBJ28_00014061 [Nothophytophthora sp. Chile5]|nr:hypothetical protein BBJ28_00014061 [Nothophytophthora sp. Chile5]
MKMATVLAPPGCCEICQIAEVLADPQLQNRSVRITGRYKRLRQPPTCTLLEFGRLDAYDAQRKVAQVSFQGASMAVETHMLALGNLQLRIGSMFQFLGETHQTTKVE